jgi:hypothetical protein
MLFTRVFRHAQLLFIFHIALLVEALTINMRTGPSENQHTLMTQSNNPIHGGSGVRHCDENIPDNLFKVESVVILPNPPEM